MEVEEFEKFFRQFYEKELLKVESQGLKSLVIDFSDLDKANPLLADKLLNDPHTILEATREALANIYIPENEVKIEPRFKNLPEQAQLRIRNLRSEHIGKFVSLDGLVRRASEIKPEISVAIYECPDCGTKISIEQKERILKQPTSCSSCGRKGGFWGQPVDTKLYDARWVFIEEPMEIVTGERPGEVSVYLKEDLTTPEIQRKTDPGNRLRVTGIVRDIKKVLRGKTKTQMDIFIEANHIEPTETEWEEIVITPEDEDTIRELASDPEVYNKIVASIAPSIYGMDRVKEAIMLQLFSGIQHNLPDKTRIRGDIHVLLIGDPSTAKSQLLKLIASIIPRGKYVAGRGTTAAGLTATVIKDEEFLGGWVLEAGAMVLANKGVLAIDEFDKMSKEDQIAMHEALEQQCLAYPFEITVNDDKVKIGDFVEGLFEKYPERIIPGKNCFILPIDDLGLNIYTTDFNKIFPTSISRVSKHKAPKKLIRIKIQNGREIIVTPEHPCWVIRNGRITTIPASEIKVGEFFPIPEKLPIDGEIQKFDIYKPINSKAKDITFPTHNSPEFCRFIGYHISDGGYELNRGKKNGINFSNTNIALINDYVNITKNLFRLKPYIQQVDGKRMAVRYVSTSLVDCLRQIDPLLLENDFQKRVPLQLLKCKREDMANLLRGLFDGDGSSVTVTRNGLRVTLVTPNIELAKQVQEQLLRFGIRSTILKDREYFKVDITGQENIELYEKYIGFTSEQKQFKLTKYLQSYKTYRSSVNIVPHAKLRVRELYHILRVYQRSISGRSIDNIGNFHKISLKKYVLPLKEKIKTLETEITSLDNKSVSELKEIRKRLGYSINDVARCLKESRYLVTKWEKTGDVSKKELLCMALRNLIQESLKVKHDVEGLLNLAFGEIQWARVKDIQIVENEDEWVYDVTVEPTRSFISECLILHNTVSVAKASIVATLPAQVSVLAGANPKFSRFDPYRSVAEQIDIPDTLLARFDLKFALRDIPDRERDEKLATHILETRLQPSRVEPLIAPEFLRKFIAYAKKNCKPKMTREAAEKLKNFYLDMRGLSASQETIAITLRQNEALMRLAESSAKIRLSDKVEVQDADRAISVMRYSIEQLGTEPETGRIDIDRTEGVAASQRSKIYTILDIIETLEKQLGTRQIPKEEVVAMAEERGFSAEETEDHLRRLRSEGFIFEPKVNFVEKIK